MSASAGRVLLIPKGAYNASTTYTVMDSVTYQGNSYVCKQTSTGNVPTNTTYWQILVDNSDLVGDISDLTTEVGNVKQALSNEVVTRATLGTSNLDVPINEEAYNATYSRSNNGYRVTSTVSNTWTNVCFYYKLPKNKDIKILTTVSHSAGTPRIAVYGNSIPSETGRTNITTEVISADRAVEVSFNTGNYEYIAVALFASINTAAQGDVTYADFIIKLSNDPNTSYTEPAMTNNALSLGKFSYKDNGVLGAKNLLPYPYSNTTQIIDGVTFTVNPNGTVNVNGTKATATEQKFYYYTKGKNFLKVGQRYKVTTDAVVPTPASTALVIKCYNGNTQIASVVDGILDVPSNTTDIECYFYMSGLGTAFSNVLVKPMIRLASDTDPTYQPYAMTNQQLTDVVTDLLNPVFVTVPSSITTLKDALLGIVGQVFDLLGNQGTAFDGIGLWTGNYYFTFTIAKLSSTSAMGYATNGTNMYCFEYNKSSGTFSKLYQFTGTAL